MHPEVSAIEKAVVVTIPATSVAIENAPAVDVLPAVTPVSAQPAPAETVSAEPQVVEIVEPAPRSEDIPLPRARVLRGITAKAENGSVEVRIAADGALTYKAFRLENPSRLVIDLDGVKNAASKNAVTVEDDVVKRVRAAQFQSAPPVARVVIDLAQKAEYTIDPVGDSLRVSFGARNVIQPAEAPKVAVAMPKAPEADRPKPVATKPVTKTTPTKVEDIPAIAENAPSWKVPIQDATASKGARRVINAPQLQTPPPTQPAQTENVFEQPAIGNAPMQNAQTLTGSRTLSTGPRVFTGEPISLNLKNADLKDVLRTFAELTGLNMAIDPDVGGSVTVDFVDVPWDQALDIILRQNGLTWTLEGNVMRIGRTDRIAAETAAQRRLAEEERLNVPTTTVIFPISYARAGEVAAMLRDLQSPRARVIVDARTNQIIVSEIPGYLQTMQNLIRTVDVPTRQVMIEARIVESSRTFSQQWGFDWGFNGQLDPALGTGTGLVFPNRVGFTGGPFGFGVGDNVLSFTFFDVLGAFDLNLALAAAESQGYIKVVSAPRVTTQDNQAAQITSGFQIPYQTRINFTTTVQYLDATLSLSVTPQITDAGTVIMDIQVQKNEPATGLTIAGAAGTPLTTRQAQTRLMVRDGGTAVIAGIFQTRDNDAESRLPFVHNIPVIGALFRSHDISTSHDELLIFITPRIVRAS
jgi:type IV pilus assembly protein PilQ